MSHLPLDARAILQYLNDLGYRNISAEQLREFLKGMQPQSDNCESSSSNNKNNTKNKSNSNTKSATVSAAATTTPINTRKKLNQSQHQHHQQQQQQQQQQTANSTTATAATSATTNTTPTANKQIKVIKSKKPLCNFKFYLDICDHQLTKRIEEQIKSLGGQLEFFLTDSVTHFITDKTVLPPLVALGAAAAAGGGGSISNANNNPLSNKSSHPATPQKPVTPGTPLTPYTALDSHDVRHDNKAAATPIGSARRTRQSRADAILNLARHQNSNTPTTTAASAAALTSINTTPTVGYSAGTPAKSNNAASAPQYTIWQTEYALRFLKKIQTELREYLERPTSKHHTNNSQVIPLKGNFIKIETIKGNCRPYYHIFKKSEEWPKIDLLSDDGAFRLLPKRHLSNSQTSKTMTRRSRSSSKQHFKCNNSKAKTHHQQQQQHRLSTAGLQKLEVLKKQTTAESPATTTTTVSKAELLQVCKETKESNEKQCGGVCEICKIEYDTLTIHLKTKDHEYFAKNPANFIALDSLIQATADVNKFLSEDTGNINVYQEQTANSVYTEEPLEEMEVDEALCVAEDNDIDPLQQQPPLEECNVNPIVAAVAANESLVKTGRPSPILREKSKRSTKGKHSSEKFATTTATTTPKSSPTKAPSPQKKLPQPNSTSMVELQCAAAVNTSAATPTTTSTRRKALPPSGLSPPMRAMLPPSSLYKVVETTDTYTTPVRGKRGIADEDAQAAAASPSLIVKFQKVRQTELEILNGEAESFMFPKTRSSSELPTDTDRQTTPDHVSTTSISSTSLESTSEADHIAAVTLQERIALRCKTTAKRSRGRKGSNKLNNVTTTTTSSAVSGEQQQRFQNAPIQPEEQPIKCRNTTSTTSTTTATSVATSTNTTATVPEATRKSSRTATAIVTAATTSSRLLRAAVEAAKHNIRIGRKQKPCQKPEPVAAVVSASRRRIAAAALVATMEDRMGEKTKKSNKQKQLEKQVVDIQCNTDNADDDDEEDEDEDEEEDDEDVDNDDDKDEDYIACKPKKVCSTVSLCKSSSAAENVKTRDVRTAHRLSRFSAKNELQLEVEEQPPAAKPQKELVTTPKAVSPMKHHLRSPTGRFAKQTNKTAKKTKSPKKGETAPHIFDFTRSERIGKLQYTFEELPIADLWHKVYMRQDACEERYYTYYGSTNYRKLPYELGPIPFDKTANPCCKLCRKSAATAAVKEPTTQVVHEAKTEPATSDSAVKMDATTTIKNSYKHKKLKLLERYQQDQKQLEQQQQILNCEQKPIIAMKEEEIPEIETVKEHRKPALANLILPVSESKTKNAETKGASIITAIAASLTLANIKCDSKASTPELLERDFVPLSEMNMTATERERAASTNSNTSSSYASSTASLSKRQYRNKQLNRIAELPPRKSPREHASTLALVSCIIRQRQDSLSKNNSEIDEPRTPLPSDCTLNMLSKISDTLKKEEAAGQVQVPSAAIKLEDRDTPQPPNQLETPIKQTSPAPAEKCTAETISSPRTTRSAAATPIEELRFATEISENVKRMRRGQNKYDHSPPVVPKSANTITRPTPLGRPPARLKMTNSNNTYARRLVMATNQELAPSVVLGKRKRREKNLTASKATSAAAIPAKRALYGSGLSSTPSSIRKIGTKKGVMEFEVDTAAMKALDAATKYSCPSLEAWLIDKYLDLAGKEYDLEATQLDMATNTEDTETELTTLKATDELDRINTPPPTDCFTSEIDLFDLVTRTGAHAAGVIGSGDDEQTTSKRDCFSFYNTTSLQSYFRKRKNLKANRTGWPKVQRKKSSMRQSQMHNEKINFKRLGIDTGVMRIKQEPTELEEEEETTQQTFVTAVDDEVEKAKALSVDDDIDENGVGDRDAVEVADILIALKDNDGGDICGLRESAPVEKCLITPPATEIGDEQAAADEAGESIRDDETIADSIDDDDNDDDAEEDENMRETDVAATDADAEEEDDDDEDEDIDDDGDDDDDDDDEDGIDNDDDEEIDEQQDAEENDQFDDAYDHDAKDVDEFVDAHASHRADGATSVQIIDGEEEINDSKVNGRTTFVSKNKSSKTELSIATAETEDNEPNKVLKALLHAKNGTLLATSTPSTQSLRFNRQQQHRHTPQMLNGSLGSCISPSEKLGDNSDIFTVSSDGLDTDLDLSNPHAATHKGDVHPDSGAHQCPHQAPKRKYDISKYAPNGAKAASSCAAEAATAAAKSLAISQFLKKEVRVTCRRLRAPFRRFRYRR